MFVEILVAILLGVLSGCITGLIPGIHVNLISLLVVSIFTTLSKVFSPLEVSIFLISLGITHSFLDVIPSVYLGAPDEATALLVMPAHKLLLKGQGKLAVMLATAGGLFSLIFLVILLPLISKFIVLISNLIQGKVWVILILVLLFLIFKNRSIKAKLWAILLLVLSGSLGLILLNSNSFKNPLHPMLSGLFGVSTILYSLSASSYFPDQDSRKCFFKVSKVGVIGASIGGFLTGLLPGISSSIAALFGKVIFPKIKEIEYITLIGGSNTANFFVGLITFFYLNKTRNGVLVGVSSILGKIDLKIGIILLLVSLISAGFASILVIKISNFCSRLLPKINMNTISIFVIFLVVLTVIIFSNWLGFIVLIISTLIGLLPHYTGMSKSLCMGCIIIPVIFFLI